MPPAVPKPLASVADPKQNKDLSEEDIASLYKVDYDDFDFVKVLRDEIEIEK